MEAVKAFTIGGSTYRVQDTDSIVRLKNSVAETGTYDGKPVKTGEVFLDSDGIMKSYVPPVSTTITSVSNSAVSVSGFTHNYMMPQCAYGNGIYVVAEYDSFLDPEEQGIVIAASNNGTSFTETMPLAGEESMEFVLTFQNDAFFICASGLYRSTDGTTWTKVYNTTVHQIYWNGKQFYAVSHANGIITSPDGITWTAMSGSPTPMYADALFVNSDGNIWIPTGYNASRLYDPITGWSNGGMVDDSYSPVLIGASMIGDTFVGVFMVDVNEPEYYQGIATVYSEDGGHTWSTPVILGSIEDWDIMGMQGHVSRVILHMNGYLLMHLNGMQEDPAWFYTTDGKTWSHYTDATTYFPSIGAVKENNVVWNCNANNTATTSTISGIVPGYAKPILGTMPTVDGTYNFRLTVSGGVPSISWVST